MSPFQERRELLRSGGKRRNGKTAEKQCGGKRRTRIFLHLILSQSIVKPDGLFFLLDISVKEFAVGKRLCPHRHQRHDRITAARHPEADTITHFSFQERRQSFGRRILRADIRKHAAGSSVPCRVAELIEEGVTKTGYRTRKILNEEHPGRQQVTPGRGRRRIVMREVIGASSCITSKRRFCSSTKVSSREKISAGSETAVTSFRPSAQAGSV